MEICNCNPRKHGEFYVRGRMICIYCRLPIDDDATKIADLEAQVIAQARTIAVKENVIRSHEAGDVIVMEALKAYAAEVAQLKEKVRYAYVQIKELESWK